MTQANLRWTLIALIVTCQITFLVIVTLQNAERGFNPHIDFTVFWGAARMAIEGNASAAFDWRALEEAQDIAPGQPTYYWLYPPTFHLLVMPLGFLSFPLAHWLFTLGGLAAFLLALRQWSERIDWIAVTSPVVLFAMMVGNISLLWSAALLLAFRFLNRPMTAGALIALLTVKPQLGLMIPVALMSAGHWRVIGWAVPWTVVFVAASLVAFGTEHWLQFFDALSSVSARAAGDSRLPGFMVTWYGFARMLNIPHEAALWIQASAMFAIAAIVALVWRRGRSVPSMALLCLAIPLATPYAFKYEVVLAAVAAALLVEAGVARTAAGLAVVATVCGAPALSWIVPGLVTADYMAPVLTLALIVAALTALRFAPTERDA